MCYFIGNFLQKTKKNVLDLLVKYVYLDLGMFRCCSFCSVVLYI